MWTQHLSTGDGTGTATAALNGVASHGGFLYLTAANGTGRLFKVDLEAGTAAQLGQDDFGAVWRDRSDWSGVAQRQVVHGRSRHRHALRDRRRQRSGHRGR